MRWWSSAGNHEKRRRRPSMNCEPLEARQLLSTLPVLTAGTPRPIDVAVAARRERIAARQAALHPVPTYPTPPIRQTIDAQGKFAYDTFNRGVSMAQSEPVRNVGVSYAKLTVANDTRKVGAAYLHAAIHGNGKQINQLSRTRLVQKVGNDFTALSKSSAVKHVGNAFTKFGRIVGDQFSKYFGTKKSTPPTHKPKA